MRALVYAADAAPALWRLATVLLLACAAWLLALLFWRLVMPLAAPRLPIVLPSATVAVPTFPRGLFGSGAAANPELTDTRALVATTLPLKLTGLIASSDPARRLAIVLHGSKQESYRGGDALPAGGARVRNITGDGVVLDENGRATLLRWPRQATTGTSTGGGQIRQSVRQNLVARPQEIADYLSVAPVRENNALRGYRINPGRRAELFSALGFKPDDLAIAINGADLRDGEQAQGILMQLPQLRAITVTVERGGQHYEIPISLDEGTL